MELAQTHAIFTVILFGIVDGAYFLSNVTKIADGGWFPLLVAGLAFALLTTWAKGSSLIHARLSDGNMPVPIFVQSVSDGVHRVGGTAIYLTSTPEGIPPALLHNLKHNQVLHADIVLLTVAVQGVPVIAPDDRVSVQQLGSGMRRIVIRYGFTEDPDIPAALAHAEAVIGKLSPARTSYFISRQTVIASKRHGMALWREHLFAGMLRNSATAMDFFKLPPNRVVELGSQVEI